MDSKELNNLEFSSSCGLWINISEDILKNAFKICQGMENLETGGIITGSYSNTKSTCNIKALHPPTSDSVHCHFNFRSGIKGLAKKLRSLWNRNEFYIGEWHFHPNFSPTPSSQDKEQLKEISSTYHMQCRSPIMLIIGQDKNKNFIYTITAYCPEAGFIKFKNT